MALLEMRAITKTFPGVVALDRVSFAVAAGSIHCLVGENGAGKSTLMKILSGVYPAGTYEGDVLFDGQPQNWRSIADSQKSGIAIIYQELALVPEMAVYENLWLGHELGRWGRIDWNETIRRSSELLAKVKLDIDPETKIRQLGVGQQQLVEIAKALSRNVKLLILDEPTAALNEGDCENLLEIIRDLRRDGVTSIMISHKLREVIAIADAVTVLRDGRTVADLDAKGGQISEPALIRHMVGREIEDLFPKRQPQSNSRETVLELRGWGAAVGGRRVLHNLNLRLGRGEIIGLAGLVGSGRTELARSIFGNPDGYSVSGDLLIDGQLRRFSHPQQAIASGLAYVSEDRKGNGLILIQDIKQNIALANLAALARFGVVDANAEIKAADGYREALGIKTPSVDQQADKLSGGNQQKVSIAKWLFTKPRILILDEPTRGIDVGAKFEIYTLMNQLVGAGLSIIMISSELPEVLGMSDRIYVVASGTITGELSAADANQEAVMKLATE